MVKLLGMLAAFVVLVFATWMYDTSHTNGEVVAAETAIKSDIDAQLPKGSWREHVETFLDAHGMHHHPFFNAGGPTEQFHGASMIQSAASAPFGNMIHECRLYWDFYSDSSERLLSYRDNAECKSNVTTGTRDAGNPMRPGVDMTFPSQFKQ